MRVQRVAALAQHPGAAGLQAVEVLGAARPLAPAQRGLELEAVARAREQRVVELVQHQAGAGPGLGGRPGVGRAGVAAAQQARHGAQPVVRQPHAPLPERRPGLTQVHAEPQRALGEARDLGGLVVQRQALTPGLGPDRGEPVIGQRSRPPERMPPFGGDHRRVAHGQPVAPFRAVRRQPAAVVGELEVEGAASGEVRRQVQPQAQVVRAPGLVLEPEHQCLALARRCRLQAIVDAQVVAAGGQAPGVALGRVRIEGDARTGFEHWQVAPRLGGGAALESHCRDGRVGRRGRSVAFRPGRVGGRWQGQCGQALGWRLRLRGVASQRDELGRAVEVGRAQPPQRRADQEVDLLQQGEAALDVLLGEDVDHLRRQADDRAQRLAPADRRADIDGDDHLRAEPACQRDRQVVDQAAVAEDAYAVRDRGEHARHAHARSQRLREIALGEFDRGPGLHVGGHGAKRDGQRVEALDGAHRQGVAPQQGLQPAAGEGGLRQPQLPVAEAELDRGGELEVLLLATL